MQQGVVALVIKVPLRLQVKMDECRYVHSEIVCSVLKHLEKILSILFSTGGVLGALPMTNCETRYQTCKVDGYEQALSHRQLDQGKNRTSA